MDCDKVTETLSIINRTSVSEVCKRSDQSRAFCRRVSIIAPDTGGKDLFVHISAVEKAGLDGLPEGAKITYDIISDRGKESAGNLRIG